MLQSHCTLAEKISCRGKHWLSNSQIDCNATSLVSLSSTIFLPFDLFLLHLERGKKKINSSWIVTVQEAQRRGELLSDELECVLLKSQFSQQDAKLKLILTIVRSASLKPRLSASDACLLSVEV